MYSFWGALLGEQELEHLCHLSFSRHLQCRLHDGPPATALQHLPVGRQREFCSLHARQQPGCCLAYDHTGGVASAFICGFGGAAARICQAVRGGGCSGVKSRRATLHFYVAAAHSDSDGRVDMAVRVFAASSQQTGFEPSRTG